MGSPRRELRQERTRQLERGRRAQILAQWRHGEAGKHDLLSEAGQSLPAPDVATWADGVGGADHACLARTALPNGLVVLTVFLGRDLRALGGPPLLWHTLVLDADGVPVGEAMARYRTHADAIIGHEAMVDEVRAWAP